MHIILATVPSLVKQFQSKKSREYFSPGRVNLIGEHTDYNGGHVFPCALTLGTYAIARRRDDDKIMLYSENVSKAGVITLSKDNIELNGSYGWAAYPIGVVWAFEKQGKSLDSGFEMALFGDIPNGSGLSSSASIEVLTGAVLRDLYSFDDVTGEDLAKIGQYSENNFNGCNCGIMDQFAVAMGKKDCAIFLDTSDLSYEYAAISLPDARIVITNRISPAFARSPRIPNVISIGFALEITCTATAMTSRICAASRNPSNGISRNRPPSLTLNAPT